MDLQLVNSASPVVMCILVCCNLVVAQIVAIRKRCTACILQTLYTMYMFRFDIASLLHCIPTYHNFSVTVRVAVRNGKTCKLPNVCFLEFYNKQSDCILAHHHISCKKHFAIHNGSTCNLPTLHVLL